MPFMLDHLRRYWMIFALSVLGMFVALVLTLISKWGGKHKLKSEQKTMEDYVTTEKTAVKSGLRVRNHQGLLKWLC
jgi:hypothetical protein